MLDTLFLLHGMSYVFTFATANLIGFTMLSLLMVSPLLSYYVVWMEKRKKCFPTRVNLDLCLVGSTCFTTLYSSLDVYTSKCQFLTTCILPCFWRLVSTLISGSQDASLLLEQTVRLKIFHTASVSRSTSNRSIPARQTILYRIISPGNLLDVPSRNAPFFFMIVSLADRQNRTRMSQLEHVNELVFLNVKWKCFVINTFMKIL